MANYLLMFFSSIFHIIKFLVFALAMFPIYILRLIVKYLPCRPSYLGSILSAQSSIMHALDCSLNGSVLLISCRYEIRGKCDIEQLRKYVHNRLILATNNRTKKLLYPEFQQYMVTWCGFSFWKCESEFDIKQHVNISSTDKSTDEIEREYLNTPFTKEKSPWEILFVPHEEDGTFTMLLKFQHALSDGASIFKSLVSLTTDTTKSAPHIPNPIRKSFLERMLWSWLLFPFRAAWDLSTVEEQRKIHPKLIPAEHLPKNQPPTTSLQYSNLLSISAIKEVSKEAKVPFTAAILAGISGGIQEYFKMKNIKIPQHINAMVPVPVPSKSNGLTNSLAIVDMSLPVGEFDRRKMLTKCQYAFEYAKNSTGAPMYVVVMNLIGSLFTSWIMKPISRHSPAPIQFSLFPGPRQEITFNGQPIIDMSFSGNGLFVYGTPWISLLTYNNEMRISVSAATTSLGTTDDVKQFIACIENEFKNMSAAVVV